MKKILEEKQPETQRWNTWMLLSVDCQVGHTLLSRTSTQLRKPSPEVFDLWLPDQWETLSWQPQCQPSLHSMSGTNGLYRACPGGVQGHIWGQEETSPRAAKYCCQGPANESNTLKKSSGFHFNTVCPRLHLHQPSRNHSCPGTQPRNFWHF